MAVVVGQHVSDRLIEQAEQRPKGSQACEVHHMIQTHRKLKTLGDEAVSAKVRL